MKVIQYTFAYTAQSLAYLKTLQKKNRELILKKTHALAVDPFPSHCRLVKGRLDGDMKVHRIRCGTYRVLYTVDGKTQKIAILDIDHRKDVYR